MSFLSGLISFFEGKASTVPAVQQAVNDLNQAEQSLEGAIEPLADDLLNTVIAQVPVVGGVLEAPADAVLNAFLGKLIAKFPALKIPTTA